MLFSYLFVPSLHKYNFKNSKNPYFLVEQVERALLLEEE